MFLIIVYISCSGSHPFHSGSVVWPISQCQYCSDLVSRCSPRSQLGRMLGQ